MARKLKLSVILLLFLQETKSDGKASSCSIPPTEDGGTAILTCKFDTNIYETKDGFQVERYSTAKNTQESLLACQWISDKLECQLHASVQFNRNISNTFQVDIPFVTSDDFGEYVCHVLPTSNMISKRCYLTRKDKNVTTDNTTLMATPTSIPETSNNGSDGVALIIASVSMAAVGILIVMKIGCAVHARLSRTQDSSKPSQTLIEIPPEPMSQDEDSNISPSQQTGYTPLYSDDDAEALNNYLLPQEEGVEDTLLNQNQDRSNPSMGSRPLPAVPEMYEVVDNDDISPPDHGGEKHARPNQNQDSSNHNRNCQSALEPLQSKNKGGVKNARPNQNQDSSNHNRNCQSALEPLQSKNKGGGKHERLYQNQDSSNHNRNCQSALEPLQSKNKDGIAIEHDRLYQEKVSSKPIPSPRVKVITSGHLSYIDMGNDGNSTPHH